MFTTPAVTALRRHFPTADICYLVERAAAPVIRHNPHVNRVIVAERPRGFARLRYDFLLARDLRRQRFDIVIDFHGGPRSAWLTRATGAPRRIGYNLPGRAWVYTNRVAWTPALVPPRHSVVNQSELLQPLGIELPSHGVPPVEMPVEADAVRAVAQRLQQAGAGDHTRLAVIHVSASSPFRRWPAQRFAELAAQLIEDQADLRIVFTAGPAEQPLQDRVTAMAREMAGRNAGRVLAFGDVNLDELRALIERASVYIGGDSGPLHIASTTRTPIVALFGPTVAERSLPWREPLIPTASVDAGPLPCRPCDQRHCVPGDFRCLTGIQVADVAAAAAKLLDLGQ